MAAKDAGSLDRRALMTAMGAVALGPSIARADGKVAVMKFAMKGLQPVTTIFVHGKGPYLVLIDTGNALSGIVLRNDIIRKLDLLQIGEGRIYGATGTDTTFAYMGHDVIIGQAAREPDMLFIGAEAVGGGLDGVLPVAFFGGHPTDLDFTTGELRIQASGTVDRSGFRAVHCERAKKDEGTLIVRAMIDGVPARLTVDTGAATTVALNASYVAAHGLWSKSPRYMPEQFSGATRGIGSARRVRTPYVQLGPYKFQDALISLSDPRQTTLSDTDGLLGIEILRRFTVGLDAAASTLWLKPNAALSDPYVYDHSGLTWEWKGGGAVVRSTAAGSPSEEVGLKPGDRILGLGTEKEAYAWDRRLSGPADTVIDMEVMRGSERVPIKMVLKDWL